MVDQRKLPGTELYVHAKTAKEVARAIKTMVIRGAPAIGVAAAYGIALGMRKSQASGTTKFAAEFQRTCELLRVTRPTAVNLFWAIDRMKRRFAASAQAGESVEEIKAKLVAEAQQRMVEVLARADGLRGFAARIPEVLEVFLEYAWRLREAQGNVTRAAQQMGIERSNLHRKMKLYGIEGKNGG